MARPFFVLLCLSLVVGACTQRVICPAYQSAFIYDKEALRKKFSYFQEDSTPKVFTASKSKYLVAEPVSYRKKVRSLQTVVMKDVNPVLPDSILIAEGELDPMDAEAGEDGVVPGAELDLAARSVLDSTFIVDVPRDTAEVEEDSVYQISKDKEVRMLKYNFPDSLKYDEATGRYVSETPRYEYTNIRFNVEQDNYMWYLRHNLILPDVKLAHQQQQAAKEGASGKSAKEKKGIKGFFKNLFKKKKKEEADTTELSPTKPVEEEFDYVDTTGVEPEQGTTATTPVKKEKKGGLFKKKEKREPVEGFESATIPATQEKPKKKKEKKAKKAKKTDEQVPEEEKPEEEDDGF